MLTQETKKNLRSICVLKQHYGVRKNYQLLRTPEALKGVLQMYVFCYINYNQYH